MLVTATAAAGAFLVMMVMMLFTVMMMVVLAATALIFMVVMMFATAAAALFLVVVVPAAATAAFLFAVMVMMTAAAATAATAAAACMTLDADGFEGLFDLGDLETDHAEHLGDVRERPNGEALGSFGHFDAAVDEGADGLLHRAQVARHVKNLFNGRFSSTETAITPSGVSKESSQAMRWADVRTSCLARARMGWAGAASGGRSLVKVVILNSCEAGASRSDRLRPQAPTSVYPF